MWFYPGNREHSGKKERAHRQAGQLVVLPALLLSLFFLLPTFGFSQGMPFPPPNQLQVFAVQQLSFGSFHTGSSGGTVEVDANGFRSATGTVVLAGGTAHQAIFDVRLIPGRLVHIQLGPQAQLLRVGGPGMMTMDIGPTDRGANFVTTGGHPFINPVHVGGTLNVSDINANPPGEYEGSFTVTFIQE
jgi:hypothetical protein